MSNNLSDPFRRNGLSESLEQYASRLDYPVDAVHHRWRAWGIVFLTGLPFIEAVDCVAPLHVLVPARRVVIQQKQFSLTGHCDVNPLFAAVHDYENDHQAGDIYSASAYRYDESILNEDVS